MREEEAGPWREGGNVSGLHPSFASPTSMDTHLRTFLNTRLQLAHEVETSLSRGGSGISAYWWQMMVALSTMGFKVTVPTVEAIDRNYVRPYEKAEAAMQLIGGWSITVRVFIAALRRIGLEITADQMESAATGRMLGVPSDPAPLVVMNIGSVSAGRSTIAGRVDADVFSPTISASPAPLPSQGMRKITTSVRKRLVADSAFYVVKVPLFAKIEDGDELPAALLFCKDKADALREANLQYKRDLKDAGGKEDNVQHGFVVGSFISWHGPAEEQVQDVGVELGKK